jgi:hypothetical protein
MLIAHKALQKLKGKGLSIYYLLLTIYHFGWDCHASLLGMMGNGFLLAGMTRRILTGRLPDFAQATPGLRFASTLAALLRCSESVDALMCRCGI